MSCGLRRLKVYFMDIHHLLVFVSVYENRSFTKASRQLYISQPTISEHIKNLENDLACKLFDRLGRAIIPTAEAEIIYPKALKVIEDVEKIKDDLAGESGSVRGPLKLGASTIPGAYLLPLPAAEFKKNNPDVSFEIVIADTGRITDMVLNHELLFGIVGAMMLPQRVLYHPFCEDELVLAASAVVAKKNVTAINDVYNIPFLMREEGSGTRRIMEGLFEKLGVDCRKLNIIAILGSSTSVKEALKAGLGASILSRRAIEEELQSGALREIVVPGLNFTRHFYLIKHKKRTLPGHYQAFYDYLRGK